ncbi:Response regulator NasT [Oleispira antarctica RB-8]|uniref:Response regulator NasT n=1 Tax=Oleispira antarctica RB-8 TaxID=698738 RepID=R4YTQ5_OLEAN|nr:Response regulator NasT [Oleispira antarctica RB-8]
MKPARVMLVDDTPTRSAILEQALLDQGLIVVCRLESAQGLIKNVEIHQPDIIIMDLESPDRDTLENMTVLNQHNPKPVIMFSEEGDSQIIFQAIQAGVSAYIVDGLNPHRVKPILDVAIARFREYQALRKELKQTRDQLADRKIIDKAKGLLMKTKGLDEEQAYHAMRKMAMDQSKPLVDIAQNILSVMEFLTL